ncbi:MAG: hypothetical protein ABIF11_07590 [Nitrospirota bacterium]
MKIAFIVRTYNKRGGISRCVADLLETLSRKEAIEPYLSLAEKLKVARQISLATTSLPPFINWEQEVLR